MIDKIVNLKSERIKRDFPDGLGIDIYLNRRVSEKKISANDARIIRNSLTILPTFVKTEDIEMMCRKNPLTKIERQADAELKILAKKTMTDLFMSLMLINISLRQSLTADIVKYHHLMIVKAIRWRSIK